MNNLVDSVTRFSKLSYLKNALFCILDGHQKLKIFEVSDLGTKCNSIILMSIKHTNFHLESDLLNNLQPL